MGGNIVKILYGDLGTKLCDSEQKMIETPITRKIYFVYMYVYI